MAQVDKHYEDFEPASDLISEDECETWLVYLPGFRKEQLRVQLTITNILRVSGECPVGDNKWKRFKKEFHVPSSCDPKGITARFEGGIIYIRQPKLTKTPAAAPEKQKNEGKAAAEASTPPQPQPQQKGEGKPVEGAPKPQPRQQTPLPQPQPQQETHPPQQQDEGKPAAQALKPQPQRETPPLQPQPQQRFPTRQLVGCSGLMKSGNLKKLVASAAGVLLLVFYIVYMFKSLTRDDEQGILEFSQEL